MLAAMTYLRQSPVSAGPLSVVMSGSQFLASDTIRLRRRIKTPVHAGDVFSSSFKSCSSSTSDMQTLSAMLRLLSSGVSPRGRDGGVRQELAAGTMDCAG